MSDRLLILRKPFDSIEVQQIAASQTRKWELGRDIRLQIEGLVAQVNARNRELQAANQRLEQLVTARTVEAVKEAKGAADNANQAKSQFLAHMSHEIRTSLNGMLGMNELLLATQLADQQRHFVETMRCTGEHLLEIINDVLDFSKIEADKMDLQVAEFDLAEAAQDVIAIFRDSSRRKGLSLECRIDPELLMNLVGNAVKFTERGGISIHIHRLEDGPMEALLSMTVCDTGIGIASDVQEKIFDPFAQADGSMTRRFAGTGLGLAIVRRLGEMMGGTIGLTSAPGTGSTFWFTVRLGKQTTMGANREDRIGAPSAYSPIVPLGERSGVDSTLPSRARILLAEDNSTNREVFGGMLELCGESVDVAENGKEVIHALERSRYDLVLMDCEMPEMDGITATMEIRRRGFTRANGRVVPIVALSGYAVGDVQATCLANGMDGFLSKPVKLKELQNVVRQWIPASDARAA